ncbi:DNA-binding transcriptional regulator, LysR family [Anaerocolumna jejuensis DSM 15929]|uniref:DNA-binding transcriptional regulator, LysR family n=1 Tax=Anaerocolumna jejuensis DSM 15929 TaxID=1121322 RepID=A0A1M6W2L6_9FIRM|nr:LysR family transcriptional regulator [Anaerocolumna jejuensis]SHK87755.1 DNA-binding transcriptional regulator, LysR family [Anaerocolumna jejuensis DSM 15929]
MISFEQIHYFLEIVRCGSLNKAAEQLYVSQPSLTKQLRKLEENLGCELLKRTHSGVALTPQGKYFFEHISGVMDNFNTVVDTVSNFDKVSQLRIGGLANLVSYFLPPYLDKLNAAGKYQVTIDTRLSNEELVEGIEKDVFDLALLSNAEQQKNIAVIPLKTEPLFVVYPVEHPLQNQKEISFLEIVMNEKLILYKDPCTIRASIRKLCNRMKIVPNIVLELDLTESLVSYVSRGDGVTILPSIVAASIQSPSIAIKEISHTPIYREISVAMKKENISAYLPFFLND